MKLIPALALLALASCGLQGCVAAALPLAAAGFVAKKHLSPAKRAANAQAALAEPIGPDGRAVVVAPGEAIEQAIGSTPAPDVLDYGLDMSHPYAPMAQYVLGRSAARALGDEVPSAVLVEGVSLANPKTVPCADKQSAVIIDVDTAPGATPLTQSGLATILDKLRSADVRIAWMGSGSIAEIEAMLTRPNVAEYALLLQRDEILSAPEKGPSKQEQRWAFAKSHCVLAMAGDQKSDFDELFDYLQDPKYATPLDIFNDRGWFTLPSPLRVNAENNP